MVDTTKITHDNNRHAYRISMDIAKEGSAVWDLTPYFKGRVGDNRFGLEVSWFYQGKLLNVTGMKPYIEGNVGDYTLDDKKNLQLASGASVVRYVGDPSDCGPGNNATYYFPEQMFPKEGIFKGYIGLLDDRDDSKNPHISGVTIWFKVLPGIAEMGHACDYYLSELEKLLEHFKTTMDKHDKDYQAKLGQALEDIRNKYNLKAQQAEDTLGKVQASIKANQDRQDALTAELKGTQHQIEINNVVTKSDWKTKNSQLQNGISQAVAQYSKSPIPYASLSELQNNMPNGDNGAYLTMDNKHIYVWFNEAWQDCGEYPAQGVVSHESKVNKFLDANNAKPPYDDVETFPLNSTVVISNTNAVKNLPSTQMQTIQTYKDSETDWVGAIQTSVDARGNYYVRYSTKASQNYSKWLQLTDKTISVNETNVQTYKDLSKLPTNSMATYNIPDLSVIVGLPEDWSQKGFSVHTLGDPTQDGAIQIISDRNLITYWRITWKWPPTFQEWKPLCNNHVTKYKNINSTNYTTNNSYYMNLNEVCDNSIVNYAINPTMADRYGLVGIPEDLKEGFVLESNNYEAGVITGGDRQKITTESNKIYTRVAWGYPAKYKEWSLVTKIDDNYYEYGSVSMFESMAVLGDSYTTGTTDFDNTWKSSTKIAWPHIMARKNGISLKDSFALGGITTGDWITKFEEEFLTSTPQDLYIIALGINDANKRYAPDHTYLGALTDINSESKVDSFYWNYSKIIKDIKQAAPNAKIICTSVANNPHNSNEAYIAINKAIELLAKQYKLPFINVNDAPLFNSDYFYSKLVGGHPTGPVYGAMAKSYQELIEKTIFFDYGYFERYGA